MPAEYDLNAGHKLFVYNGTAYVQVKGCENYSGWGQSCGEIDVADHDDPSVKTINSGRIDYGSITVTYRNVTSDPGQTYVFGKVAVLDDTGGVLDWKYLYPDGTTTKFFKGHVTARAEQDHNLEGAKKGTFTIRRVGPATTTDPHTP
jgi:hypothetical protein